MTREEADFIGGMNMCNEISNEAYRKIMCHCEEQEPMAEIDLDYVIKQKYIERDVLDNMAKILPDKKTKFFGFS